ncbi:fimbrial protein [Pseudomonas mucidolens]|nr:fimbrial protein [Pseudomonas mucidolens]
MLNDPSPIGSTGLGWRWVYNGRFLGAYPSSDTLAPNYAYTLINTTYAIALYKIGEITPGSIPAGEVGTHAVTGGTIATMTLSNAIALTEVSCQTPSVNVDLGKQRSSQFGGVGTTIGKKAFNINLTNCPLGLGGISYRLDPVNTAFDAQTGVLALDEGGATGVGIQITDDSDKAVSLGETHQFRRGTSLNHVIPLKAAYYKTANTVTGGKANASMQFTITYQ